MPNPSTPVTPRPSPAGSQAPTIDDGARASLAAAPKPQQVAAALNGAGLPHHASGGGGKKKKKKLERLRADMIKRVDVPVRINEMSVSGWLKEKRAGGGSGASRDQDDGNDRGQGDGDDDDDEEPRWRRRRRRRDSYPPPLGREDEATNEEMSSGGGGGGNGDRGRDDELEMSDFPVTRPGSRPAGVRTARDPSLSDDESQQPVTSPAIVFHEPDLEEERQRRRRRHSDVRDEDDGSGGGGGENSVAAGDPTTGSPPRGRSTLPHQGASSGWNRTGTSARGLEVPPSMRREMSDSASSDAAGHVRA